jgi:hypothetical protein
MAVRMTHLIWRKGWAYFRFKLPDDLASKAVPEKWPDELNALVNAKLGTFKVELWKSLELTKKDEQRAKRVVAAKVAEASGLIDDARMLLARGPQSSISAQDIAAIAARVHADRLARDESLREQGIGLQLPNPAGSLLIPTNRPASKAPSEPGLTEDDLGLLRFASENIQKELQDAVARMRPTASVKQRVGEELAARGIELPAEERRKVELEVLKAELRGWTDIGKRLQGEIVPTPVIDESPAGGQDPTLKQAFAIWRDGVSLRGGKVPSVNTANEAEAAVRRFVELHGNLRVSSITRAQVRSFRDAMIKLPATGATEAAPAAIA